MIVVGDLNCDVLKILPETDALNNVCSSLNLTQLVTSPKRVTVQSSSLIHVIISSNTAIVVESEVVESHIIDHYLVYSVLNLKLPKPPPTYVTARTYRYYDADKLVDEIVQLSWAWNDNSIFDDINEKLEHFNNNFLEVLNRHTPIKSMRFRYHRCT